MGCFFWAGEKKDFGVCVCVCVKSAAELGLSGEQGCLATGPDSRSANVYGSYTSSHVQSQHSGVFI